jgi:hypothetical protein
MLATAGTTISSGESRNRGGFNPIFQEFFASLQRSANS